MTVKERYDGILEWFQANKPEAASELSFNSPFELLVAVILSAQCTDKRVNTVTPGLFRKYPTAAELARASYEDVRAAVSSISYPNVKARHLVDMSRKLVADFNGEVPHGTKELQSLPGVGRKTANVVASIFFGTEVVAVDTHVFRVARRLGLSRGTDVATVEKDLTRNIPAHLRARSHHWLLLHGRYVCTARNPHCGGCPIGGFCKEYSKQG